MTGGGESPPPAPSTTTQIQDIPPWEQGYVTNLLGQAQTEASKPYQAFPGQQVAGFTPDQQQAFSNIENAPSSYSPLQDTAKTGITNASNAAGSIYGAGSPLIGASAGAATPQGIQSYMSPYTSSVVQGIESEANKNWNQNIMPGVNDAFVKAGQFGSGRNAQVLGQAADQFQTGLSSDVANALQSGYGMAGQQAQNEATNLLNAGTGLGNLAATQSGALNSAATGASNIASQTAGTNLTQDQALQAVGQQQQGLNQTNLNTAQQNWSDQTNWNKNQLDFLNQIIRGLPAPTSTTSSSSTSPLGIYSPSPLSSIGGAGAGALSLLSPTGSLLGTAGHKRGGRVGDDEPDMSPLPRAAKKHEPVVYEGEDDMSPLPRMQTDDGEPDMEPHGYEEGGQVDDPDQGYTGADGSMWTMPQADTQQTSAMPTASAAYPDYSGAARSYTGMIPSDVQKYQLLAMARGMMSPTKTGSPWESMGNAIEGASEVGLSQSKLNADIAARRAQALRDERRLDIQDKREQTYEQAVTNRASGETGQTQSIIRQLREENPDLSYADALEMAKHGAGKNNDQLSLRREALALDAYKNGAPIKGKTNPTLDDYREYYGATTPAVPTVSDTGKIPQKKPTASSAPDPQDALMQARDAIKAGAPRAAVVKRLQGYGIDASGL